MPPWTTPLDGHTDDRARDFVVDGGDLADRAGHDGRAVCAGSASDTVGRIIAARLSEVLGQQERLRSAGVTVVATDRRSPDYLKKFLVSEIAQWAGIIKASGVSLD
jgi:hypothetical protein